MKALGLWEQRGGDVCSGPSGTYWWLSWRWPWGGSFVGDRLPFPELSAERGELCAFGVDVSRGL